MKFSSLDAGKITSFHYKFFCLIMFLLFVSLASDVSAAETSDQVSDDCGECHSFRQNMLETFGGSHGTEIGCLDCHSQHSPETKSLTVACDECHDGETHYQIKDCLHCHLNPHKPLYSLRDPIKPAREECISCHAEVGEEMATAPSLHSELYCTRCHDSHTFIPSCLDCHEPHLAQQTDFDCLHCHPAHSPSDIVPTGYIPRTFCQVCHIEESRNLANTNTNHGVVNCKGCHKGQHTSIPNCRDCHGLPHLQKIHSQQRDCLACHGDAHLLIIDKNTFSPYQ